MNLTVPTLTDLFCGAGGSTLGAVLAGAEARLAINHWPRAIETHQRNHPRATHVLTDISRADPRQYPGTMLLIASPECTNHSLSKGKPRKGLAQCRLPGLGELAYDPAEERSRCTMWDPLRFAEVHAYPLVILENVVDVYLWVMWEAWLHAWQCLDYEYELVSLNSMFVPPTPQSRDRLYFVAWKKGVCKPDLAIRPLAFCPRCARQVEAAQMWKNPSKLTGKYRQQYVYGCPFCNREVKPDAQPAATAIDWSLPPPRIGDRKRPLKPKTMARIAEGLRRLQSAFTLGLNHEPRFTNPLTEVLPTQTSYDDTGLVTPFIAELHGGGSSVRPITEPGAPVCAGGLHHGLVVPPGSSWIYSYYEHGSLTPVEQAIPTVTTLERHALVTVPPRQAGEICVEDCGFRMLAPHEIQAAMGFPREYLITGNRSEKVKQLGNAVTPPVMQLLVSRCLAALSDR